MADDVLKEYRLPADALPACINILLAANAGPNANRKDVVCTVAEIVRDLLHRASETQENQHRVDEANGWCLKMTICLLENVEKVRVFCLHSLPGYVERSPLLQIVNPEQASALDYIFRRLVQPNTANRRNENITRDALKCETLIALTKRVSDLPKLYNSAS